MKLNHLKESPTTINFALKLEKPITDIGRKYHADIEKLKKNFDNLFAKVETVVVDAAKNSKADDSKTILKNSKAITKELLQHFLDKK